MFSHKNTAIASKPRLDIWIKGMKVEQVRKHLVLGLIFDTRINRNEHILIIKAEKINKIIGTNQGNLFTIHKMIKLSTSRY
jgi:hypothetical protein